MQGLLAITYVDSQRPSIFREKKFFFSSLDMEFGRDWWDWCTATLVIAGSSVVATVLDLSGATTLRPSSVCTYIVQGQQAN